MKKTLKIRATLLLAVVLIVSLFGLLSTMDLKVGYANTEKYTEVFTKQETSIRLQKDGNDISGIRFIATADLTNSGISSDSEFGFLLAKTANLNGQALTLDLANFDNVVLKVPAGVFKTRTENEVTYQVVITGIPESDYGVNITAVPYLVKDGATLIAQNSQDFSIAQIASLLISEGYEERDAIIGYVNAVVQDVTLTASEQVELTVGETLDLGVTVEPANLMPTYETSNNGIVTVSNGVISAISAGDANISVAVGNIVKTVAVTVKEKVYAEDVFYANDSAKWAETSAPALVGTFEKEFEGEKNVIKYITPEAYAGEISFIGMANPVHDYQTYIDAGYTHVTFKFYASADSTGWYFNYPKSGTIILTGQMTGWKEFTIAISEFDSGCLKLAAWPGQGTFAITEVKAIKADAFYINDSDSWAVTNTDAFVGTYMEMFEGESNVIKYVANSAPNGTAMTGLVPKFALADYQAAGYTHVAFKLYVGSDVTGEWYLNKPANGLATYSGSMPAGSGWSTILMPIADLFGGSFNFFIPATINGTFAVAQAKAIKADTFWMNDSSSWAATSDTKLAGSYEENFEGEKNVIKYTMDGMDGSSYMVGLAPIHAIQSYIDAGYTHVTFKLYVGGDVTGTWFFTAADGDPSMAYSGSVPAGWNTITVAISELASAPYFWCAGASGTFAITSATAIKQA